MNIIELTTYLSELPSENTREYELSITKFVGVNNSIDTLLEQIIKESTNDDVAYNAFYCLNVIDRRNKDYATLQTRFDEYGHRFRKHITYDHLVALFYIESDGFYDYDEILRSTYKDSIIFCDNAGFVHAFANVFVTIYEKGGIKDPETFIDEWYDLALNAINNAIKLDPNYAKYYCTKARIICIKGEYKEADVLITKAISLENSKRNDYALRISNYQYYKMMVQMYIHIDNIKASLLSKTSSPYDFEQNELDSDTPIAYTGTDPYIFISYSHKDKPEVLTIIRLLEKNGIRIWYDNGLTPGEIYTEEIASKISHACAFVFMISPHSIDSEYCRREIHLALNKKLPFYTVSLCETTLSDGMIMTIDMYEHIHWYGEKPQSFLNRIVPILKNKQELKNDC